MQKTTKAHCNDCGGEKSHDVLHVEQTEWRDPEFDEHGWNRYEMLRCRGCEAIHFRHVYWSTELQDVEKPGATYFPPAISRRQPPWAKMLVRHAGATIHNLMTEIYVALQNGLPRLAAMGVRAVLEHIMIAKTGDHGSFANNVTEFEKAGYLSRRQAKSLEPILQAGHATIHRAWSPSSDDLDTLLDVTEGIIASVYLHERKATELAGRVPARKPPKKKTP